METLPRGVVKIIRAALGPRDAGILVSDINRWLRCSGPEWTVARLKAIRTGLLQHKAGNQDLAVKIWQSNSISYHHGNFLPSGIWNKLGLNYIHAKRTGALKSLDAVIRSYTAVRNHSLTHTQYLKAKKAITGEFTGNTGLVEGIAKDIQTLAPKILGNSHRISQVVDVSRLKAFSGTHHEFDGACDLSHEAWGRLVMSLWTSAYLPESVIPYNPAEKFRKELVSCGAGDRVAGHISFIQEGGCKGRVVAVPNAWVQAIFQLLHNHLDKIARRMPASCVHDQNKGAFFMKSSLESGKKLYCFDLSSATDRFPLIWQTALLRGIGLDDWASGMEAIASAPWRVDVEIDGERLLEEWSYTVGQPMGLYGSFPLFHVTHYLLILVLAIRHCKMSPKQAVDSFRVLGDDVIIIDRHLAAFYNEALKSAGVEVSPTKSIISDNLGEFAGFLAHKSDKGVCVYRPYKYGVAGKWTSPLNLLNALGSKSKRLGPYWAEKYRLFTYTQAWRYPDLSPVISNLEEVKTPPGLNSHLLGALSNKFSYYLGYCPSESLLEMYEDQQILLLGQKERRTASGFASANLNPIGIAIPEESEGRDNPQSMTDPLMREAATGELLKRLSLG